MKQFGPTISSIGLDYLGLTNLKAAHWNYSAAALYEQALIRGEATVAAGGPLVANTETGLTERGFAFLEEMETLLSGIRSSHSNFLILSSIMALI